MYQRFVITAALACVVACGSSSNNDNVQVSGTVSGITTQSGRAVAMTAQGRAFWTALDANGRFSVSVPANTPFRLVVASAPATGLHAVVGHVVGPTSSTWLVASASTDLGTLKPSAAQPAGTTTKSETADTSGGDGSGEKENDSADHEDDSEDDALCGSGGAGDAELHADNAPAESHDSGAKADEDHEDEVTSKACH